MGRSGMEEGGTRQKLDIRSPFCPAGKVERFYGKSLTPPRRHAMMVPYWKGGLSTTKPTWSGRVKGAPRSGVLPKPGSKVWRGKS